MTKQVLPKEPPLDTDVPDEPSFRNPTRPHMEFKQRSISGSKTKKVPGIRREFISKHDSNSVRDFVLPKTFDGSLNDMSEVVETDVIQFKSEIAMTNRPKPEHFTNPIQATPSFNPIGPPNKKIKMSQGIKSYLHDHDYDQVINTGESVQDHYSEANPKSNILNHGAIDLDLCHSVLSGCDSLNESGIKLSKVRNLLGFFFNNNFKKEYAQDVSKRLSERSIKLPKSTVMKDSFIPSPSKTIAALSRSEISSERINTGGYSDLGKKQKLFGFMGNKDQAFVEVGSNKQIKSSSSLIDSSELGPYQQPPSQSDRSKYYKPKEDFES
jgi:hypothetical protein